MMMRSLIALMVAIVLAVPLLAGTTEAKTMYVTDVLRLTLRSEPGSGSEIVGVLKSGQSLEIVEENEQWAQVRLPEGKEGWVPIRFLTPEKTADLKLARLQQSFDTQKNELAAIRIEAAEVKKQNELLSKELDQQRRQAEEAQKAYDQLKEESADYLQLKSEHRTTVKKAAEQSSQIIDQEKKLARLETQRLVRWFLAGAGVLLLGFIIGFSAKRQRRKYLT